MIIKIKIFPLLQFFFILLIYSEFSCAQPSNSPATTLPTGQANAIEKREAQEDIVKINSFVINYYKPTYILPYYYTASPDNQVYVGSTPDEQSIKSSEAKFQISFKVPLFPNLITENNSLYFAYTQLSYWQVYSKSEFFRETDYEPEIFFSRKIAFPFLKNWALESINLGAVHQSNGFGGNMERTWNRVYLEAVLSNRDWMVRFKPWYVIHNSSYEKYNPNLSNYLGHGQIIVAYKLNRNIISLLGYNFFQKHSKRSTIELAYSFPITLHMNGYVQFFSGYGQSLIEYNHRTNSAGLGISLNNWI